MRILTNFKVIVWINEIKFELVKELLTWRLNQDLNIINISII